MAESDVAGTSESCTGPTKLQLDRIWSTLNFIFTDGGKEIKNLRSTDDGISLSDIFEACIPPTKKKQKKKAVLTIATFEAALKLEEEKPDQEKQPYTLTHDGDTLRVKHTLIPPSPQPQEPSPQNLETPPGKTSTELTGEMEEQTGVTSLSGEKAEEGWSQSRSESKESKKKEKCISTDEEENNWKIPNEGHFDEENDPAKSSSIPGATGRDEVHQTESSPLLKTDQQPKKLQKIWSTLSFIFTKGGQEKKNLPCTNDEILLSDIFKACIPQNKKKNHLEITIATFEEALKLEEGKPDYEKQPYTLTGDGDSLRVKHTPRPSPQQPREPPPQNLETPPGNTSTEEHLPDNRSQSKKSKKKHDSTEEEGNISKRPKGGYFNEENDTAKSSSIQGASGPNVEHQTNSSPLPKTDQQTQKQESLGYGARGQGPQGEQSRGRRDEKEGDHRSTSHSSGRSRERQTGQLKKIWSLLNYIFTKEGKEKRNLPCTNDGILLSKIIEEFASQKNTSDLTISTFEEAFCWEKEKPDNEKQPYTLTGNGDKLGVKHTPKTSSQSQESNKSKKKHESTEEEENISKRPKGGHFNAENDTAKSSWIQGATGPPDIEHQTDSSPLPKTDQQRKKQESSGHGARGQEPQREQSQGRRDGKEGGRRSTSHSPARSRERQAGQASSWYGARGQGPQGEHSQGRRDGREDDRRRTGHSPRRDREGRDYRDPGRNEQTRWTQDSNRRQGGQFQYDAAQGSQPHYEERGQSSYQNRRGDNSDMRLSKSLSNVLRHRAKDLGFNILPGGFIYIDELLKHKFFRFNTQEDVLRVVENNDKKRFHVDFSEKRLKIRANQGHTMEVDVELREIEDPTEFPEVTHGTYFEVWEQIKKQGLSTMGRNHIHFAPGEPGESGVISGMRGSCELIIYIDMAGAMADGIKFFVSANNVILTKGNKDGVLNKKYFQIAVQRRPRMKLSLE